MSHVIVPIDTNRPCHRAIDEAVRFAKEHDTDVLLLHVVPWTTPTPLGGTALPDAAEHQRDRLFELARECGISGEHLRFEVCTGSPVQEIARRAYDDDTIVMGSHPLMGWRRLLRRSTAAGVVRRARCNVIVVPER